MSTLAIFESIGVPEILIILAVALVLFGSKKIPEIGRSLGKGIKEFKGGVKGFGDDVREGMGDEPKAATPATTDKPKDSAEG